jgi:hypothetical protein
MLIRLMIVLLLFGLSASNSVRAVPVPTAVVVCYPGGAVNQTDANSAMSAMLRVVERVGDWPQNQFDSTFTAKAAECRRLLSAKSPAFAITTLGLYLDLRVQENLVPLIQPRIKGRSSERYRVIARKGKFAGMEALKGHTLGGTVLEDLGFVARIVFAGHVDLNGFDLKPSTQAIRALRSLDRGELDALILNEQQYAGLASLQLQNPLEVIFTSDEIPLMGVVANTKTSTAEERTRFAKALEGMCSDTEGRKACDLFGVESFGAVDPRVFEPATKLWSQGH